MKKKIPIAVLELITPVLNKAKPYIKVENSNDLSLSLKDADPDSKFYFKCGLQREDKNFVIDVYPVSRDHLMPSTFVTTGENLPKHIEKWVNILKDYSEIVTIYDDPILKSYEQEFEDFTIVNPEDDSPLNIQKQIYLDNYLTRAVKLLKDYKETVAEDKVDIVNAAIKDCESFQEELPELNNNETAQRLAHFWAKTRKAGIGLFKKIYEEFQKKVIEAMAKDGVQRLPGMWDGLWDLLN